MSPDVLVVALASVLGLLISPWLADRTDALIAERVEEPRPTSRSLVAFCSAFGFAVVAAAIGPHGQLLAYLFLAAVLVVLSIGHRRVDPWPVQITTRPDESQELLAISGRRPCQLVPIGAQAPSSSATLTLHSDGSQ